MREDGLEGESGEWWEEDERKGGVFWDQDKL